MQVAGLRDAAGNAQVGVTATQFVTGAGADLVRPTVVATNPETGATGVARDVVLQVAFSEAISPATVTAGTVQLTDTSTNQVVEATRTLDASGQQLVVTPQVLLKATTPYQLWLQGLTDTAGNRLQGHNYYDYDYTYFTTAAAVSDTVAPTVVALSPPAGATEVPVNARVVVRFGERVDPLSLTATTVQLRAGTAAVAATLALEDGGQRLTVTPVAPLATGDRVRGGARRRAGRGGQCAVGLAISFTTSTSRDADTTYPQVAGVDPPYNATGVSLTPSSR